MRRLGLKEAFLFPDERMVDEASKKRQRVDRFRRKHERNKFRKTTNATVHRKDLGYGLRGFLFSCTPHHENQCFRDGVILLSKFCEDGGEDPKHKSSQKKQHSLEDELNDLRSGQEKLFTRVDGGVNGAVFVKINNHNIDLERVVESALRDARQSGNPGSRHCIRLLPIYTTCYAKAQDAAKATEGVVKEHFPKIEDKPVTYAIAFRSRVNNSAKRDDFIPAIAATVERIEPRYKVNLTKPDVVLLVEVLKTSCCIGVFQHYYDLAKMNLREAACPSKPNESKVENNKAKEKGKTDNGAEDAKDGKDYASEEKGEKKDDGQLSVNVESQPAEKEQRNPTEEETGQEVQDERVDPDGKNKVDRGAKTAADGSTMKRCDIANSAGQGNGHACADPESVTKKA